MLQQCANGFGAIALAALLGDKAYGAPVAHGPNAAAQLAQFTPKARNVIFLYMDGGVSAVDSFDPKPRLNAEHGQPFKMTMEPTQFDNNGNTLGCPWEFRQTGETGHPVSDLFPYMRQCVDDLCIVRSMVSDFSEHNAANYFLHTGHGLQGRPSMGAWATYGLGSENQDLPGFVVLNGGLIPSGGVDNFSSGFLPATYQASFFRPDVPALANVMPLEQRPPLQQNKLNLMRALDEAAIAANGRHDALESAIANYELAYRMQMSVPELTEIDSESEATKRLYGFDSPNEHTRTYARECLVARRLIERGVRFIELTCPAIKGVDRWDAHSDLKDNHGKNAVAVDQPIAGLLKDLKSRGLLDETLVLWAGEFGRTPFAQGSAGRDHNPFGYTIWMAGGGVKPGTLYGATDEYGYKVVENRMEMHDLHATILHLLGFDHTKLTFRYSGRDMRLTDVHGNVFHDILA
ncbi:MAG: DUF1501 domain-containing protein [Candidatus Hydrogenedentes bacterium]|nr:DUF1501 domain-containing protein [Candidatus Hydrogenedentota bacterium]